MRKTSSFISLLFGIEYIFLRLIVVYLWAYVVCHYEHFSSGSHAQGRNDNVDI